MLEFDVQAMSCSHCVAGVTEAVRSVDPLAEVQVDLEGKKVSVESSTGRERIVAALTDAGYSPR